MSIEQTKLFKKRIETPELRTNTFTSENLEGNNILADTIWFAGHDLEDTLFGDNIVEMVFDPIEIISKANTGTISYGAEQIIAFQMKVTQDYKGKYMTSVTLRRCDTNTGSGKPVAQLEQVYLYANCMNSEGEVIDIFYSLDKHQQTQDDGLQTTWHFEEPIKISKDYEFIRFYCTRVRGEAQTNVNLRSSNIKIDNTRQYINGWKTVDQASIKEFTTDFYVSVYQRTTGLLDHVNDTTIHVTAEDKERWDNLEVELNAGSFIEIGENNTISVKTADTLSLDENTVPTTKAVYLEIGQTLTDAQTYADEAVSEHINQSGLHTSSDLQNKWNNHVDDDTIHVTAAEKEKWNTHIGDDTHLTAEQKTTIGKVSGIENNVINLTTKYNDITEILNNWSPDIETFSTLDSGAYVIKSGGKSNATGVQLSREHFTTGSIKMIQIYHSDGMNVTNDIRLCAIVYNHGETESTQKTIDDCIFSTNTQSQMSGVGGCMCFKFNDLELPNDYEFVRFIFADATKYVIGTNISNETHVIPVHTDANTIVEARVQILAPKVAGTEGEYIESPDDDCKTLHKSGSPAWSNWYPHVRAVKTVAGFSQIISLINRVSQLEARVNELEKS